MESVKLTASTVLIDPDLAAKMLERSGGNRQVSQHIVNRYAKAMAAGEWALNGESVVIDEHEVVLDGQHRLWAVIQSGASVRMLVVRGARRDSFATIDCGKGRTPADALSATGRANTTILNSVLAWLQFYERAAGRSGWLSMIGRDKTSHADIVAYADQNPDAGGIGMRMFMRVRRANRMIPAGPFGAFAVLVERARAMDAESFLDEFVTIDQSGPPVSQFHSMMSRWPRNRRSQQDHATLFGLMVKCHNLRVIGSSALLLRFASVEAFPAIDCR